MENLGPEFLKALTMGKVEHGGYQDGRVVDLRQCSDKPLYLVGDVHARHHVIPLILQHAELEPLLAAEQAFLVFLGDLHHREDYEGAGEMESSVQTFRRVMRLKIAYPRSVYILLGNHEFTRSGGSKRGYFQGELFREALVEQGLYEVYNQFFEASPLVVIYPGVVGVHAGPALGIQTLEQLKQIEVKDRPALELEPAALQLCFSRHVDWTPNQDKAYCDHDIREFLELCSVPGGRLIAGHTPLCRETDWMWSIGEHLTVVFAAGREIGYFRVSGEEQSFVRVGRFEGEEFRPDRSDAFESQAGMVPCSDRGRSLVQLESLPADLHPDVEYVWQYPGQEVRLRHGDEVLATFAHFRHLPGWLQSYYAMGYYLVGDARGQEILKLKIDLATILGGEGLREGVRFRWGEEFAIVRWLGEDRFVLRPLVGGLSLA